jgi:nitrate/nitrite transporter NarK
MEKPTGLKTLALNADVEVDDKCEMAKRSWNSARRAKLAYGTLVFVLALVLALAAVYAVVSFKDDKTTQGILGVIGSVGALLTTGVFGTLAKSASEDEQAMWERVDKTCPSPAPAPAP